MRHLIITKVAEKGKSSVTPSWFWQQQFLQQFLKAEKFTSRRWNCRWQHCYSIIFIIEWPKWVLSPFSHKKLELVIFWGPFWPGLFCDSLASAAPAALPYNLFPCCVSECWPPAHCLTSQWQHRSGETMQFLPINAALSLLIKCGKAGLGLLQGERERKESRDCPGASCPNVDAAPSSQSSTSLHADLSFCPGLTDPPHEGDHRETGIRKATWKMCLVQFSKVH